MTTQNEISPDDAAHWLRHNQGHVWASVRREAEGVAHRAMSQANEEIERGSGFFHHPHHSLHETQIAYVMRCFAMVDGLSQAVWGKNSFNDKYGKWKGERKARMNQIGRKSTLPSPQTWRMMAFLNRYMGVRQTPARLSVEMYRHTPMHEGYPHGLIDGQKRIYMWFLGWEAAKEQHMCIWRGQNGGYLLGVGTLILIRQVERAIEKAEDDVLRGGTAYRNYLLLDQERWDDELTWTPRL